MKRIWILGAAAGLVGVSLSLNQAWSQLPPIPHDNSGSIVPPSQDPAILAPIPEPMDMPLASEPPRFDPPPSVIPSKPQPVPQVHPIPIPDEPTQAAPIPTTGRVTDPKYHGPIAVPSGNFGPTAWQPGGYAARRGNPYYYTTPGRNAPLYSVHNSSGTPWAFDHSSYQYHFGPGYYRHSEGGHYRFPYYTYRAPWYFPGHPIYNRDTNRPW